MKPVRLFWKRYDLTQQGQFVKQRILEQISLFEITFKKWKNSRQQSQTDELKEIVLELGSAIMLSDQLDGDSLQELKSAIVQTTPATVDYQTEIILDAIWYMMPIGLVLILIYLISSIEKDADIIVQATSLVKTGLGVSCSK